jgi:hypothetical protein
MRSSLLKGTSQIGEAQLQLCGGMLPAALAMNRKDSEPVTDQMVVPNWSSLPPFATLDLCLAHVRTNHPQRLIACKAKDINTGEPIDAMMPAYLYRGEVGWFDNCFSRRERVRRNHFPGVTLDELDAIDKDADNELQSRLATHQRLSRGLMQHYGFPTELMDASACLETAGFFSRFESGGESRGAIAVFGMAKFFSPGSTAIDLSEHPMAVRARRQRAYGLPHQRHSDLKDRQAISDMGITWYTFLKDDAEVERISRGQGLLSVSDDHTAGILRLWLDGSIAKHGKVSHPMAKYLAHRIAQCPLVTRVVSWHRPGQPKEIELITPDQAGIAIDMQHEIDTSIKLWSRHYPTITSR